MISTQEDEVQALQGPWALSRKTAKHKTRSPLASPGVPPQTADFSLPTILNFVNGSLG